MGILLSLLMLLGLLFSLLVMLMGILISLLVMIMMMLFSLLVMLYMILLIVLLFLMEYHIIQRYLRLIFLIKKKNVCHQIGKMCAYYDISQIRIRIIPIYMGIYLSIDRLVQGKLTTHKRQTKVTQFHILFVVNVAAVQKIITIYTIGELQNYDFISQEKNVNQFKLKAIKTCQTFKNVLSL